jgi:nitrite reductase/ring-hydroxylating ferredoxin subunit
MERMAESDACSNCELQSRRSFVARATAAIAMATVLMPGVARASALPRVVMRPTPRALDGAVRLPIPTSDGATIDVPNEIILVRIGTQCMAFALSCPHQRAMLRTKRGDSSFQCPKHKSEYRADGTFVRGRATRNMDRYQIRRDGAELVVDTDSLIKSDEASAAWVAAVVAV